MGSVWVADHVGLQIPCALKFIHEDAEVTDEHRSRFKQEAHAAARLKSRYVVQMLDHGVWKNAPYIAMELLEGELLSTRLEREKKLSPAATLSIMRGVARALASATELGIVHRDLKPENIFLVAEAGEEYPKVLDFGVAKLTQPHLGGSHRTKTGALIGTPWYMSPEQIDGTLPVDQRSDLWALSVIAYQCVTGELPFESTALGNLMLKIVNGPRPVPTEIAPDLPPGFDAWWARSSEREAELRFQTAEAWFEALERALDPNAPPLTDDAPIDEAPATKKPKSEPPASERRSGEKTFAGQARSPAPASKGSPWLVVLLGVASVGAAAFLFWPRDDESALETGRPTPPPTSELAASAPTQGKNALPTTDVAGVEPWQASASAEPDVPDASAPPAPEAPSASAAPAGSAPPTTSNAPPP
jgi:serine/threonine-protein kinase